MSKKRIPDKLKCMYQSAYNDWAGMAERAYAAEARAEAAEKRVQELEAQLAAQAWRPVTEEPPEVEIDYLVWHKGDVDIMMWTNDGWMSNLAYWSPTHWQPLPPPPTGNE